MGSLDLVPLPNDELGGFQSGWIAETFETSPQGLQNSWSMVTHEDRAKAVSITHFNPSTWVSYSHSDSTKPFQWICTEHHQKFYCLDQKSKSDIKVPNRLFAVDEN